MENLKLNSWSKLENKLHEKFISCDFIQMQYMKKNSLTQDVLSVHYYMVDFDKLCLICDLKEVKQEKIASFINGLN